MRFEELATGDERAFARLVEIYEASLPATERKPVGVLQVMLARDDYRFVVARRGEGIVGFGVVFVGEEVGLLEYLAVDAAARGAGVGAGLFRECAARVGAGRPMLVEVEEPDDGERQRRVAFYRRLGCREVEGLRYILPLPGGPPPMRILVAGFVAETVAREAVRRWLVTVYTRVYGQVQEDGRIGRMVAGLSDPVRLV